MKDFEKHIFDPVAAETELAEFNALLNSKDELSESNDILPFFRTHKNIVCLMGMLMLKIDKPERIAFEYDFFGDFAADLAIGDKDKPNFFFVEFEDARENSIFAKSGRKYQLEFGKRFEHGFSQVIDWFYKLDDLRNTSTVHQRFGSNDIAYDAILVIGRDKFLDNAQKLRLSWRTEHVIVNSKKIYVFTFDELYETLLNKLSLLKTMSQSTT